MQGISFQQFFCEIIVNMKSIIIPTFIVSFTFGNFGIVWSVNYQQGLDEYKNFDYNSFLTELKTLAEEGNKVAQYSLGTMYHKGKGLTQNYKMVANGIRFQHIKVM